MSLPPDIKFSKEVSLLLQNIHWGEVEPDGKLMTAAVYQALTGYRWLKSPIVPLHIKLDCKKLPCTNVVLKSHLAFKRRSMQLLPLERDANLSSALPAEFI